MRSLNMLYLEEDNTRRPTRTLRQLFLPTLIRWLSVASNYLFRLIADNSEGLGRIIAVELLRSPFYLCVSPHIPTLHSVETNRHPQVPYN